MRLRTHRPRYYVGGGVLLLGGAIAVSIFLRAQGPPKTEPLNSLAPRAFWRNPGPPPPPLPEFVAAEKELKTLDEVGSRLMKLPADEKRPQNVWRHPLENRHETARWLGELRYPPAIPMLIQYIDTEGPSYDDGPTFPCREALEMFGDAAVPRLVDAFLEFKGRGQTRSNC